MGIGKKETEYEQATSLYDSQSYMDTGLLGIGSAYELIPEEVVNFCYEQYKRFGIDLPPKEVVQIGAHATFMTIDVVDPYCIFFAGLGVDVSSEWCDMSYQILDERSQRAYQADTESIESFVYSPGGVVNNFNHYMAHPGLDMMDAGDPIRSVLDGEWYGEDATMQLGKPSADLLYNMCRKEDGKIDEGKVLSYFELSAWAAWCWLFSQAGQEYLFTNHDIMWACKNHGECILYEGILLEPSSYTKINRAPQSCEVCGLDAWCVDLIVLKGESRFICEHHLNGDVPLFEDATCGSRVCRHVECHHHPLHGQKDGLAKMLRQSGQLSKIAQESRECLEPRTKPKQIG